MSEEREYRLEQEIMCAIIRDFFNRPFLEDFFGRIDYKTQLFFYEKWTELISEELVKHGIIPLDKKYVPVNEEEFSLYEACVRVTDIYYISRGQREEQERLSVEIEELRKRKEEEREGN